MGVQDVSDIEKLVENNPDVFKVSNKDINLKRKFLLGLVLIE